MKRHHIKFDEMVEASDGEWVKFSDVEVLLVELNLLRGKELRGEYVPEGFKLVPIVPTVNMVDAGAKTPGMKTIDGIIGLYQLRNGLMEIEELKCDSRATSAIGKAYTAMVEAAPSQCISGPTSKPECICPKCGLRHGGAVLGDLGF